MRENVNVLIAGDIFPTPVNEQYFIDGDVEKIFGSKFTELFRNADFSICNLEGALTESEAVKDKSGVKIKAPKAAARGLSVLGLSAVSMANNHVLDFGEEGFKDGVAALEEYGIDMIGAGPDEKHIEKYKIVEMKGFKLGFYCVAENLFNVPGKKTPGANVYDEYRVLKEIKKLKKNCDYVFVLYHGGAERIPYNTPWIRERFRRMADNGADVVISQHTHAIGLEEHYNDSYFLYGQGNFLFHYTEKTSSTNGNGILLDITVSDNGLDIKKHFAKRKDPGIVYDENFDTTAFDILTDRNAAGDRFEPEYSEYAANNAYRFLEAFRGQVPADKVAKESMGKKAYFGYLKKHYTKSQLLTILKYLEGEEFREYAICAVKDMIAEKNKEAQQKAVAAEKAAAKEAVNSEDVVVEAKEGETEEARLQRLLRKQAFHEIFRATGWSDKKIKNKLDVAKELLGVNYRQYCLNKLYNVDDADLVRAYKERTEEREAEKPVKAVRKAETRAKNFEEAVEITMKKTGWDREKTEAAIREAKKRTRCLDGQYYLYKFYEKSPEEQETYLTQGYAKDVSDRYDEKLYLYDLLRDKERCNYFFSDMVKRPWCVNRRLTEEQFTEVFKDTDRIFYKPLHAHHGDGAQPMDLSPETMHEMYEKLMQMDEGVVEGYVKQHPKMKELAPSAVNTMRVVFCCSYSRPVTEDGRNFDLTYVSLKMGGVSSVVDNLAGGGMVAVVDTETGCLCTDAFDEFDHIYKEHPASGITIKGFEIPYFKEAIEQVEKLAEKYQLEGFFGWDVAVAEDGPELIEPNILPGTVLYQLPYVEEGKGLRHILDKYLF